MVQSKQNPDYQGWELEDQKIFIQDAKAWLVFKGSNDPEIVRWLYQLGRDWRVLRMTYDDFHHALTVGRQRRYSRYYRYSRIGHGEYRQPRHYVKREGHEKKDTKSNKQAWREHKKIDKDKRKCNYGRSWRRWAKKYGKGRFRQHTKRLIAAERWDDLGSGRNDFANPWYWD